MTASATVPDRGAEGPPADQEEPCCRICFAGAGESGLDGKEASAPSTKLVSPCKCQGSQKYVHIGCLRRWQRSVQLGGSNHPEDRSHEDRHFVCNVCKSKFTLPPQDRASIMAELAGVAPEDITPGVLLVCKRSAAHSSAADGVGLNITLRAFIESKAAHFREAVYVLTEIRSAQHTGDGSDAVLGVNLSRRLQAAPDLSAFTGAVSAEALRQYEQLGIEVIWMNGGPVEPKAISSICVSRLPAARRASLIAAASGDLWELSSSAHTGGGGGGGSSSGSRGSAAEEAVLCGSMEQVLKVSAEEGTRGPSGRPPPVLTWAGFAQWSRTQLLGEMARGSWGWCRAEPLDVRSAARAQLAQPGGGEEEPAEALWDVLRHSDRLSWAPDNELAREFQSRFARTATPAPEQPDPQAAAVAALAAHFEAVRRGLVPPTPQAAEARQPPPSQPRLGPLAARRHLQEVAEQPRAGQGCAVQ